MATLIPALGACVSRMTLGEKRLAERLEQKLDDDYLLWYDVPMGPRYSHPDYVVMHPRRGILILEVKDWKLGSTILHADKSNWEIMANGVPKTVPNPLEQARLYAHQVVDALKRDPQLVQPDGQYQGHLAFPWSYCVVLTNFAKIFLAALFGVRSGSRSSCKAHSLRLPSTTTKCRGSLGCAMTAIRSNGLSPYLDKCLARLTTPFFLAQNCPNCILVSKRFATWVLREEVQLV